MVECGIKNSSIVKEEIKTDDVVVREKLLAESEMLGLRVDKRLSTAKIEHIVKNAKNRMRKDEQENAQRY